MKSLDCLSNVNIQLIYLYGAKIASLLMPSSEVTLVVGMIMLS